MVGSGIGTIGLFLSYVFSLVFPVTTAPSGVDVELVDESCPYPVCDEPPHVHSLQPPYSLYGDHYRIGNPYDDCSRLCAIYEQDEDF